MSTVSLTCNVRDPVTGQPYTRDPRFVAQKAEIYLKSTGIADISYWGPEIEFYVLDNVRFDQSYNYGFYYIDSEEGFWNSGQARLAGVLGIFRLSTVYFIGGSMATYSPVAALVRTVSAQHPLCV